MLLKYCPVNATLLPVWNGGISLCFFYTVQPSALLIIAIVLSIYHHCQIRMCKKDRMKKTLVNSVGLVQSVEYHKLDLETKASPPKRCFKDFPFPEFPVPFLYVCQLLLHAFHILLPILHLIVKLIICRDCISGVTLLCVILQFVTWLLGFKGLKHERNYHCCKKIKSHSVVMLVFWTLGFLFEVAVFISWNSVEWYLQYHQRDVDLLDLGFFCCRLTASFFLFLLGFHAPGMYRDYYDQVCVFDYVMDT